MIIDSRQYQQLLSLGKIHVILKGSSGAKGITIGNAKIGSDFNCFKEITKRDILVVPDIRVTDAPYLEKNSIGGIVTDKGTCIQHGAILCRYFNIPCVVGTINATTVLKDYEKILIDGSIGRVYRVKEV